MAPQRGEHACLPVVCAIGVIKHVQDVQERATLIEERKQGRAARDRAPIRCVRALGIKFSRSLNEDGEGIALCVRAETCARRHEVRLRLVTSFDGGGRDHDGEHRHPG